MSQVITYLLWFGAIGCGLLAGLYFAFSTFIMSALGSIEQVHGISAMNSINSTILKSLFMPFFFGTTLVSLILAIVGVVRWGEPGTMAMLAGGLIYVAGMFLCTMFFNVPLNNALASVDPASAGAAPLWARYLKDWTFWNHLRTISSTAASALYVASLAAK
jgi:uncharacterized membrane protein